MTIDSAAAGGTDYVKQEGYSANIGPSITSIKADLFIDPSWEGKTVTTSLWGATASPSAWPRVEFTNKDGTPHITSMRSLGGEPVHNGSVPVTYGSTVTVEVAIDPVAKGFVFYANDAEFYRYDSTDYPASWNYERYFTTFNKVFVKAWNTGVDGDDYTATWSNLELGTKQTATPEGISLRVDGNAVASGFVTNSRTAQLHWDSVPNTERYEVAIKRPGAENFETHYANTTPRSLLVDRDYFGNTDGTYEYKVRAKSDTTGQWSSWTDTVQLSYDTAAPVIDPITANGFDFEDGATVSGVGGVEFQFTITDELAGHDYTYAEVKKANGEWVQGTEGLHLRGNSPTWTIPADRAAEGNYVLKLSTRDKLGNSQSTLYEFRIDNSIPTFNLSDGQSPRQAITSGSYLNLSKLNSESEQLNAVHFSGKQSTDALYINNKLVHNHGYFERSNSGKIGNLFSEEGEYTVYTVNALGTKSAPVIFTVDSVAPEASIEVSSPTGTSDLHRDTVRVTGVVDPAEQNIKSHWIEVRNPDGTLSYAHNMSTNGLSYSFDLDTSAGDGKYHIRYVATDKAGNRNDVNGATIRTITVDNTAPEFAITSPANESIVRGTRTVVANITDPSDITKVLMSVKKKNGENISLSWEAGKSNTSLTRDGDNFIADIDTTLLADGANYITLRATDGAGNVRYWNNNASHRQHMFVVDNTNPTEVSLTLDRAFNPTKYTLSANDTIGLDTITAILRETTAANGKEVATTCGKHINANGDTSFSIECAIPSDLADGEYNLRYNARDLAGNQTTSKQVNFTIDTTAPGEGESDDGNGNPDDKETTPPDDKDNESTSPVPGGNGGNSNENGGTQGNFTQIDVERDLPSTLVQALRGTSATPASIAGPNLSFMTALAQATPTPQVQAITEAGNDEEMLGTATNLNQNGEVLGASTDGEERWSLLNAIAAGIAVLLGILALLGMRRTSEDENVHAGMRIMTAAIAAAGVVALFMTENFATEMGWMNGLTWVFGLGLVVQIILLIMARRTASE